MQTMKEYKCPSCGGALAFDAGSQRLKCPYCDSDFDIEVLQEIAETDATVQAGDHMDGWEQGSCQSWTDAADSSVRSYVCHSCGGEILADVNTGATTCPFCGNNVVLNETFTGLLKPDLIVPFQLDKKAAKAAFSKHLSGKKLLPKAFKQEAHIDEIKGIYVPFWLYNADVDGAVKYSATKVRSWSTSEYHYTETSFYEIYREGAVAFQNIPVDGSSKMPDDLMDSLEPFDLTAAVDFNPAYFAGYLADKYDVTAQDDLPRINNRVKHSTEDAFSGTITGFYQSVSVRDSHIDLKNGNARYALLPVWLLNTTWKGEKYLFAMNGQTGKFVGNLPMDRKLYRKYWLLSFLASIPVGVIIAYIVRFFIG